MRSVEVTTPPVAPVVTTADVKAYARIDGALDTLLVDGLVAAATSLLEKHTRRVFRPTEYTVRIDNPGRPRRIVLPRSPVSDVATVEMLQNDGTTWTEYPAAGYERMGDSLFWTPAPDVIPSVSFHPRPESLRPLGVRVRFTAGYPEGECPPDLIQAVKALAAFWYEQRIPVQTENATIPRELAWMIEPVIAAHRKVARP